MLVGIDVGETFTDAVAISEGKLVAVAKAPTTHSNLLEGILQALDEVLQTIECKAIERVTLSTTIVTNQIVEGREEPTDIYVIPGPGADITTAFPVVPHIVKGYTDHRGMVREEMTLPNTENITIASGTGNTIQKKHCAISAKFAVRNPKEEHALAQWATHAGYDFVSEGSQLSGTLNFPRRTNSAYYNSAVSNGFTEFRKAVEQALVARHIEAPLYILKADGGSLPMKHIVSRPVETIFTGPAASVLGMVALVDMPTEAVVAIDIGGTTSDISLWEEGQPIMARGGVDIKQYPTSIRSFAVTSVGIGGDSAVYVKDDGTLAIGPERKGPAMALGGKWPTLGDALITLGVDDYGDKAMANKGMQRVQKAILDNNNAESRLEIPVEIVARSVVNTAVQTIVDGILVAMHKENKKPVYVVRDIVEPHVFAVQKLVAVGGTATSLAPFIADALQVPYMIPAAAPVANAVGAAVSCETMELTAHVDTSTNTLVLPELGRSEKTTCKTLESVIALTEETLREQAQHMGISENENIEIIFAEEFPVIQGWGKESRLITVRAQLKVGVKYHVQ